MEVDERATEDTVPSGADEGGRIFGHIAQVVHSAASELCTLTGTKLRSTSGRADGTESEERTEDN